MSSLALHPGWVDRRRAGETATQIAREEGVSRSLVSARTVRAGPFPRHPPIEQELVEQWVADRRAGWSAPSIARRDGVEISTVRRVTDPLGPFRRGRRMRGVDEPVGMVGLSRLLGVADPTVWRWYTRGLLPAADFFTEAGRPRWSPATIQRWLDSSALLTCATCGARCVSLVRHEAAVHRDRNR